MKTTLGLKYTAPISLLAFAFLLLPAGCSEAEQSQDEAVWAPAPLDEGETPSADGREVLRRIIAFMGAQQEVMTPGTRSRSEVMKRYSGPPTETAPGQSIWYRYSVFGWRLSTAQTMHRSDSTFATALLCETTGPPGRRTKSSNSPGSEARAQIAVCVGVV